MESRTNPAISPQSRKRRTRKKKKKPNFTSRLKGLDCFEQVHERIVNGWRTTDVVRFIQEEKGEYTDAKPATVARAISEYAKEIPPSQMVRSVAPSTHTKAVTQITEGLDVLRELEELFRLQQKRIQIDATTEKNINKLFKSTVREVKEARAILQAYAQVQMDFGITKRNLGVLEVDQQGPQISLSFAQAAPAFAEVAESPKSRQKALGLVHRMLALAAKKAEEDEAADVAEAS